MKTWRVLTIGSMPFWTDRFAVAQSGHMMDGNWGSGWMGGYGGMWIPILLLAVLVGVVVIIVRRK
jgi:uncharacterized membrane protein